MTTENKELIRCSCCKCKKLPEFFELKETTGQRLKTCIKCRSKFVCDYENCEYKCKSEANLQIHIKFKHSVLKPFSCKDCDLSFKLNGNGSLDVLFDSLNAFDRVLINGSLTTLINKEGLNIIAWIS